MVAGGEWSSVDPQGRDRGGRLRGELEERDLRAREENPVRRFAGADWV